MTGDNAYRVLSLLLSGGKLVTGILEKTGKFIYRFAAGILTVFVAAIILAGLVRWDDAAFLAATQKVPVRMLLVVAGAFLLAVFFLKLSGWLQKRSRNSLRIMMIVLAVTVPLFQVMVLSVLEISYLWDGVNVFASAVSRLRGGGVVELYFSRYANQNSFLLYTVGFLKVAQTFGVAQEHYMMFLNICNMIFMDAAILLGARIIWRIRKHDKGVAVVLYLVIMACNPFVYLWTAFYYTSILVMPMVLGAAELILGIGEKEKTWQKILRGVGAGILLAAGYRLRQTTMVLIIALVLAGCIYLLMNRQKKKVYGVFFFGALVMSFFLTFWGVRALEQRVNNLDTSDSAFPAVHWIMMGLDHSGEYTNEDAAYTAGFVTHEEKVAGDLELIRARLDYFGVKGISKTYGEKFLNTWTEASNAYPFRLSVCGKYVGVHDLIFGPFLDGIIYYHQIYQVFLMVFILAGLVLRWKKTQVDIVFVLQLTFLGTILFHLLWEAGPLYSVSFKIIYVLLGTLGILCITDKRNEKENEYENKRRLKGHRKWMLNLCFGGVLLLTVAFFARNFRTFTVMEQEWEKRVVNQYLASDNVKVGPDEEVTQTFLATRDFNYLNIHLCNHENEKNTSVYQLTVAGEKSGIIYEETIEAKSFTGDYFLMRQFDNVNIKEPEEFKISIKTLQAEGENFIEVARFQMKEYDPYGNGVLEKNGEKLEGDMFLMVSQKILTPYAGKKKYCLTAFGITGLEAFLWFWTAGGMMYVGKKRRRENSEVEKIQN